MSIITAVIGHRHDIDPKYGLEPLLLTSEERASAHFVAKTVSGRSVRVSLPRGTDLQDGDVLAIEGDWAVVVTAAEEDLLLIQPGNDAIHWWAACYQLGNLHRPARFLDDGILTPDDPMAMQILAGLGVKVERVRRPFVGRRFGSAQGLHHHGHAHDEAGHDHSHHDNGHVHAHDADKGDA
jgi:urease accessory protein